DGIRDRNVTGVQTCALPIYEIYPPLLRQIIDPPLVLYCLGDKSLLQQFPSISVIGTRKPSSQAKDKLASIVTPLIKSNWVIVSRSEERRVGKECKSRMAEIT